MLNKIFISFKTNLKNTIFFSLAVGVFCGVFGGLPILKDTSFTDMAGGYEWWVIFALIICANSKSFLKAGLYCGLFFLITQPLQFFIQALLYSHNYVNALNYFKIWLPVIILTCPGGMAAYFINKENILSVLVLIIGNLIEMVMACHYFLAFINRPPFHLLAFVVSLFGVYVMSFIYQKKPKYRLIGLIIPLLLTLLVFVYAIINNLSI